VSYLIKKSKLLYVKMPGPPQEYSLNEGYLNYRPDQEGPENNFPFRLNINPFVPDISEVTANSGPTRYYGGSIFQQNILKDLATVVRDEFLAVQSDLSATSTSLTSQISSAISSNSQAVTQAKTDILAQLNTKLGISDYNTAAATLKSFVDLIFSTNTFYSQTEGPGGQQINVQLDRETFRPPTALSNYTLTSIPPATATAPPAAP